MPPLTPSESFQLSVLLYACARALEEDWRSLTQGSPMTPVRKHWISECKRFGSRVLDGET